MTPKERELIQSVANRLKNAKLSHKDAEAEALIGEQVAAQPDAVYKLTQAVILQEYTLSQAQQRLETMEKELQDARSQASAEQAGQGSFLGGLFGGGRSAAGAAGTSGARASSGQRPVPGMAAAGRPGALGQSAGGAPGYAGTAPQRAGGSGMGDFMRSAAAMAVGVAGGHLLFNSLSNMFGDDPSAAAEVSDAGAEAQPAAEEAAPAEETAAAEAPAEDTGGWGADDAGDPAVEDLGGDFGGGDFAFGEDSGFGGGFDEAGDAGEDWGGGFDDGADFGDDSFG
jgi:hypothetical protein